MSMIRPTINVLDRGQIEEIHRQSLQILTKVGVRVDSQQGRQLFARAIGREESDRYVRLPAELVEWAIESTPSLVKLFDRTGKPAFQLGDDLTRFGIGVTSLFFQDPLTDQVSGNCPIGSGSLSGTFVFVRYIPRFGRFVVHVSR